MLFTPKASTTKVCSQDRESFEIFHEELIFENHISLSPKSKNVIIIGDFDSCSYRGFWLLFVKLTNCVILINNLLELKAGGSHRKVFYKKIFIGNFTKFTGKHLWQSLFSLKLQAWPSLFFTKAAGRACNFSKKETLALLLSCEFCEISKNTFFTEHRRATSGKPT